MSFLYSFFQGLDYSAGCKYARSEEAYKHRRSERLSIRSNVLCLYVVLFLEGYSGEDASRRRFHSREPVCVAMLLHI